MSNIEEDNKNLNEPEDQFVNYSFDDDEPVSGGTYTLDDIENLDGLDGEATYIAVSYTHLTLPTSDLV